jgi:Protein of unknown function (DUF3626)
MTDSRICDVCFIQIEPNADLEEHLILCRQEQISCLSAYFDVQHILETEPEPEPELKPEPRYPALNLTKTQRKAIRFFRKKAKLMSRATRHLLLEKVLRLGYDENDFALLIDFVSQAPLISFVPLYSNDLFDAFDTDPRMKNLFEVGKGRGTSNQKIRAQWESTLFNKLYDESEPEERAKYGVFNLDGNPNGVLSASGYGDVYFVFHEHVKKRTTMVYGDSSGNAQNLHIATPDRFCNIMHYLPDDVIKSIIQKARDEDFVYQRYSYVEIQIHGEIRLDRDVKQIIIDANIYANKIDERLEHFCQSYDIDLIVI